MQSVQFVLADATYSGALRDALVRSGPWHVVRVDDPDPSQMCVVVMDEDAFNRSLLPLSHPERVVLITRKDPSLLAQAWDAGVVSVVSEEDPISTVLLAIMAAALRVATDHEIAMASGISPNRSNTSASLPPQNRTSGSKRCKIQ